MIRHSIRILKERLNWVKICNVKNVFVCSLLADTFTESQIKSMISQSIMTDLN